MTRLAPTPTSVRPIERRAPAVDPAALAVAMATAYVEVRSGRRPPEQLRPLLAPAARRRLRAVLLRHRGQAAPCGGVSTSRVVTSRPHDDALEAVVVLRVGADVVAVAVRVDRVAGRWWVTDLGAPEDRQPLVPPGAPQPPSRNRLPEG